MSILHRSRTETKGSTEGSFPALRNLALRVPCEACGAAVRYHEQGIVTCSYCGDRQTLGSFDACTLFVPFELTPEQATVAIKRWLREKGHRATAVSPVAQILVPYWWSTRRVIEWHVGYDTDDGTRSTEAHAHEWQSVELALERTDGLPAEVRFEEQATTVLPLDRSLISDNVQLIAMSSRAPIVPTSDEEMVGNGSAGGAPGASDDEVDGDTDASRLPSEFVPGPDDGDDELSADMTSIVDHDLDPFGGGQVSLPEAAVHTTELERCAVLVYVPFYTLRFTFEGSHHTVLACGRTGGVTGMFDGELRSVHPIAAREEVLTHAVRPTSRAARCPGCATPLALRGRLLGCPACDRVFRNECGDFVETSCVLASGEGTQLPFWCFEEATSPHHAREPSVHADIDLESSMPARRVLIPAFAGAGHALVRRVGVRMAEQQPRYNTLPCTSLVDERVPCARPASEARALAELTLNEIDSYLGTRTFGTALAGVQPTVIWVPFEASGGFLTDPVSGVRIADSLEERDADGT